MSPVRSITVPARWLGLRTEAVEEVPCFSIYLANERIGEARMTLTDLGTNPIRTLYLGCFETRLGELAILVEVPPVGEAAVQAVLENETASRALDATSFSFDFGRVEATVDPVFGYWTVTVDGEAIAECASQADALAVAHKQVES